jgi:hypothetical protein
MWRLDENPEYVAMLAASICAANFACAATGGLVVDTLVAYNDSEQLRSGAVDAVYLLLDSLVSSSLLIGWQQFSSGRLAHELGASGPDGKAPTTIAAALRGPGAPGCRGRLPLPLPALA